MPDRDQTPDQVHEGGASTVAPDRGSDGPPREGDSPATTAPRKPFYKRPVLMTVLVLVVLAAVVGGLLYWLHARHFESTDDAFIDGHVVQMTPKVAGYVVQLRVEDNQLVHRGDLVLEIDSRDYRAALDQAKASQAAADAKVRQAEALEALALAGVMSARANVAAAEANATNAAQDLTRIQKLVPSGAATPEQRDAAVAAAKSSAAALESSKAKLVQAQAEQSVAQTQVVVARAGVQQSAAQIEQAQLNLSYTRLLAPAAGRVTHRTVERGDFLQPGQALFAIVEPTVWVTANYKETQLTDMRPGQPVTVTVDAYPHHTFAAHVDSFQRGTGARFSLLPAENATGNYVKIVQRVPVKIVFDEQPDPAFMLAPGMSVVPKVRVR